MNPRLLLAMFDSVDTFNADYPAVDRPINRIAYYYNLLNQE